MQNTLIPVPITQLRLRGKDYRAGNFSLADGLDHFPFSARLSRAEASFSRARSKRDLAAASLIDNAPAISRTFICSMNRISSNPRSGSSSSFRARRNSFFFFLPSPVAGSGSPFCRQVSLPALMWIRPIRDVAAIPPGVPIVCVRKHVCDARRERVPARFHEAMDKIRLPVRHPDPANAARHKSSSPGRYPRDRLVGGRGGRGTIPPSA